MVVQRLLAVCVIGLTMVGCSTQTALKLERSSLGRATIEAQRSIVNEMQLQDAQGFAIRSLDPQAGYSLEYRSLATSLHTSLTKAGFKEASRPQVLFLIGHALELGSQSPWDRTIVVYGYDVASGKRVYQARITSSGQTASAYEVGDAVFPTLIADIKKSGQINDRVSVPTMTRS